MKFGFSILVVFSSLVALNAKADLAHDLLLASDQGRGGIEEGLAWTIKITTTEDGETTEREFFVQAKDHDALVEATAPPRNKGEVFLFNDRMMWFYKPGLKKPVGISARQKLSGQAANGDIASTHYARDYSATLQGTDTFNGEKMQILRLKAKTENLTYDQINYWISEKTKLARKAEFLTLQGTVFKIGELDYQNQLLLAGKQIPFVSRLKITDAKFPENISTIEYSKPKVVTLPTGLFNINRLSR